MATAIELHKDDVESLPEREVPVHPAGKVTGFDEETGLPIVKRSSEHVSRGTSATSRFATSNDVEKHEVHGSPRPHVESSENREQVQGSTDPKEIRESAKEQKPNLEAMAEHVAAAVPGAEVAGVRVKKAESQENKAERGKPAGTNIDNLGARVAVDEPGDLKDAKEAAKKALPVVGEDKIEGNGLNAPQLSVKTGKPGEANQVSEIQLITKDQDAAMAKTEPLYEKQKEALAKGDKAEAERIGKEIEKVHKSVGENANTEKRGGRGESPEHDSADSKGSADSKDHGKMGAEAKDGSAHDGTGNSKVSRFAREPQAGRDVRHSGSDAAVERKDSASPQPKGASLAVGSRVTLPDGEAATVAYAPAKGAQLPAYRFKTDDGKTVSLRANQVEGKVKPEDDGVPEGKGWIGADLDGTMAKQEGKFTGKIGAPVPRMIDRVKRLLNKGEDVRVFTARIDDDPDGSKKKAIEAWTKQHIGQVLPVTNRKDPHMKTFFDDRAVQIERNEGTILGSHRKAAASA